MARKTKVIETVDGYLPIPLPYHVQSQLNDWAHDKASSVAGDGWYKTVTEDMAEGYTMRHCRILAFVADLPYIIRYCYSQHETNGAGDYFEVEVFGAVKV